MKTVLKVANRLTTVPLLYLLIAQMLCLSFRIWGSLTGKIEATGEFVIPEICFFFVSALALIAFCSLCRMETMYDDEAMKRYAQKPSFHTMDRLAFLWGEKEDWAKLALIAVLHMALPMKWTFAAFHAWLFGTEETLATKWQSLALLLPILLVCSFLGRLAGVKQWHRRRLAPVEDGEKAYNRAIAVLIAAYLFGGFVLLNLLLPLVANYVLGFYSILSSYALTWIVILVVGFFGGRWLRAFLARRKFVKRLSALTRRDPVKIAHPYRSVLSVKEGVSDFSVESKGKLYTCKLISTHNPFAPLYVGSDGLYRIVHQIRLRGVEFFRWEKEGSFAFSGEGQKVLIINPVPRKVFGSHLDKTWPLDNGDRVGEYRVYTATAFLNALERECLDRMG